MSLRAGIASVAAAGLGVVCEDFDGDGWIDIYVANDAHANQLWLNRRDGTFRDRGMVLGAAVNSLGQPEAGMGVVAADLDGDASVDLFMTHLDVEHNTFYRGLGRNGFQDMSGASGLGPPSVPYTGFGVAAFDIELDGDLDVVVANGRVVSGSARGHLPAPWNLLAEPKLFHLNDGTGRFRDGCSVTPAFCDAIDISRGLAVGDVDRDGDLDILVGNLIAGPRLFRNDATRAGHWLVVRAVEPALRRDALGARLLVEAGGRRFVRSVIAASSYQSATEPEVHFGLGLAEVFDAVEVAWPDGSKERFPGGPADRRLVLRRGDGEVVP